jgi:hypothetical protein
MYSRYLLTMSNQRLTTGALLVKFSPEIPFLGSTLIFFKEIFTWKYFRKSDITSCRMFLLIKLIEIRETF